MKTGHLVLIGNKPLGRHRRFDYSACVDCETEYPHVKYGPSCNGTEIHLCPWCRPDSKPGLNGRGL